MFSHNFKKYILRGATALVLAVGAAAILPSCIMEDIDVPNDDAKPQTGYITLKLKCSENVSRATEPGVDDLNENVINSVTLLLSPYAGNRTPSDEPVYFNTFANLEANGEVVLRIPLDTEMVNRLFGESGNNKCHAFAAVNVAAGNAKTEADLRALVISSQFATRQRQPQFTMDGDGIIDYTPQGNYAVGNIDVQRSAAKITLALDVDDEVEETVNGEVLKWRPDMSSMYVTLQQGVQISTLDPAPTPNMDNAVYFNSSSDNTYDFKTVTRPADDKYARYDSEQKYPFYTYPNKWTGNLDESHGTYMMLVVPWSSDGGRSWRPCYYHVPIIPNGHFDLTRNISYHVFLHVGVLGSFVPDEPLEIEGDYYVANWGQENINVDIKDYRYLVVDQNDFVVNNEPDITIPFYTSHETIVTDMKMTFYRYNFSDQGSEFAVPVSMTQNRESALKSASGADSVFVCKFNNENNTLYLNHSLNIWVPYNASNNEVNLTRRVNGTRADVDNASEIQALINTIRYFKEKANDGEYSRIEYEVTVQHKDVYDGSSGINKSLYKETVRITQYPGMYITAVQNYCGNLGSNWTANANYGNTYINGNTSSSSAAWNSQIRDNQTYNSEEKLQTNGDLPTYLKLKNDDGTIVTTNISNWNDQHKLVYQWTNWSRSIGLGSPEQGYYNWNPNLYLVTITQLSQELGAKYKIDDPRTYNVNNYLGNDGAYAGYTVDGGSDRTRTTEYWYYQNGNTNLDATSNLTHFGGPNPRPRAYTYNNRWWCEYIITGWTSAPALYGSTPRTLQYYYPTMESDNNKMTIAPKFRICSSYAGSRANLTREMARRRAAAYQEMGYPAGRWRLPTYGEVEYVMLLAAQLKIPRLFGVNTGSPNNVWAYWCAQGAVVVPPGDAPNKNPSLTNAPTSSYGSDAVAPFTGNNYRARTRFVYDEWYWGEGTLPRAAGSPNVNTTLYTFTWGDQPKSSPVGKPDGN